ncbi:nucleoside 2-deoxyribosyltransferase [Clostridium sp.]|uniref:nucleoside 2-deoxyribosyltransferase n=1 Tax=Clostridium sp. TaxID=1506 RepID=UPI002625A905|nr:nucleoside 2-deoxyribosyltransferase [Clostridium sp.]
MKELKNEKIYVAGSLFSEAEIDKRLKEEKQLREIGFNNIFNPINSPQNSKENIPTSADIFWGDTNEVLYSDMVIADISNSTDLGVSCELGIVWACNHLHFLAGEGLTLEEILSEMKKKKLVAHLSDIRKSTAHRYSGNNVPWGVNQYVIGLVEDIGTIKDSFKEVLEELNK